jgi:autotransporter-associated beta strand protein
LADPVTITNNSTGSFTLGGAIGGTGTFTQQGPGRVILNANNSWTGNLFLNAGILQVSANNRLGNNANDVTLDGGSINTTGSFTWNAGRVFTLGAAGGTFDVNAGVTSTFGTAGQLTGAGALTKTGSGSLSVAQANAGFTGNVTINAGNITVGADDALGAGGIQGALALAASGAELRVNDNIGLRITGGYSDVAGANLRPGDSDAAFANVFVDGIHFANGLTNTVNANMLPLDSVNDDAAMGASGANTVVNFNGTWFGDGNNTDSYMVVQNGGRFNVTSSAVIDTLISGTNSRPFWIVGDGNGTVEFQSGFIADPAGPNVALSSVRLSNATWITNASQNLPTGFINFENTAGGVWSTRTNNQTFGGAVTFNVAGTINTQADLILSNTVAGAGAITKTGDGTLSLTAANTFSGALTVTAGEVRATNSSSLGTSAGGTAIQSGAALWIEDVGAPVVIQDETITISGTGDGTGAIRNLAGAANELNGNIVLAGNAAIRADAGTTLIIGDFFSGLVPGRTVNVGANSLTFDVQAGAEIRVGTTIAGSGNVIKTGSGTLNYLSTQPNTLTGTTFINDGTLILDRLDAANDAIVGPIVIGDGAGAAGSAVLTYGPAPFADDQIANTITVTIQSDGRMRLNGQVETIGSLVMTGGSIDMDQFNPAGAAIGTLTVGGDGVGSITTNASAASATISGQINLGGATRTISVADGAAANDLVISPSGTGVTNGSINKTGSGVLQINGAANAFAPTNIQITGGTLLLGASNQIADTTTMALAGGTFNTGGFNETLSTLSLTADSTIDFASGASILTFDPSNSTTWDLSATLLIANWSGSEIGGGTDQLIFGSSGGDLSMARVGTIFFVNPPGRSGLVASRILPTGEVVPVPEPEAVAALLVLAALAAWRERVRFRRLIRFRFLIR